MGLPPFKQYVREASRQKRFRVDYSYASKHGAPCRTSVSSSNMVLPFLSTSETAVLSWLRQRHTGCEVTIIALDWTDLSGKS